MKALVLNIDVDLDLDDLVALLIDQYSDEDLIKIIRSIDTEVAELEFTEKLRDYFDEEVNRERAVIAEEEAYEEAKMKLEVDDTE